MIGKFFIFILFFLNFCILIFIGFGILLLLISMDLASNLQIEFTKNYKNESIENLWNKLRDISHWNKNPHIEYAFANKEFGIGSTYTIKFPRGPKLLFKIVSIKKYELKSFSNIYGSKIFIIHKLEESHDGHFITSSILLKFEGLLKSILFLNMRKKDFWKTLDLNG